MGTFRNKFTDQEVKDKIELCKSIHNNKYTYDKMVYVDYDTKVIITCPIHGDFKQILYNHSKGRGCGKCRSVIMSKIMRKDKDDFVNKSNEIHNNKYSYDKVPDTFGVRSKVTITCPIHGDFEQVAFSHKRGCGCPYCKGKNGVDNEKGYSIREKKIKDKIFKDFGHKVKLIYLPRTLEGEKIILNCDIHGPIKKNMDEIFRGRSCGKCQITKTNKKRTKDVVNKLLETRGDKFEYLNLPDVIFKETSLNIKCKEHDYSFNMKLYLHESAKYGGCIYCLEKYKEVNRYDREEVINKFRETHGDLYCYDNVIYEGSDTKVIITCLKHGDFPQTPSSHVRGSGCPSCKHSTGEKMIQKLLTDMDLKYKTQKTFYGCVGPNSNVLLTFDLYVPEFHTCIEFDGYQHFTPVQKWGGEETFKGIQMRDNVKNGYCKDNDIDLIRIPYTMDKLDIVNTLNQKFNKNHTVDIKRRTKWIDINIRERVKQYKSRSELMKKDGTLYNYCRKNNLLDDVCGFMGFKHLRYTYNRAKEICLRYNNFTTLEKELPGLINYIRKNKFFELVIHIDKKRKSWSDEYILSELKKYEYKIDVRKNDPALYSVSLKRKLINHLKDKTIWWTEQMVIDVFKKCRTKKEIRTKYRGAENYALKHGLYKELSKHFVKKI
jgi:hypothetical protein